MTKQAKRRLIPLLVLLAAVGVLASVIFSPNRSTPDSAPPIEASNTPIQGSATDSTPSQIEAQNTPEEVKSPISSKSESDLQLKPPAKITGKLSFRLFHDDQTSAPLGSLTDPESAKMEVEFSRSGAGIQSIRFSDIFPRRLGGPSHQRDRDISLMHGGEGFRRKSALRPASFRPCCAESARLRFPASVRR